MSLFIEIFTINHSTQELLLPVILDLKQQYQASVDLDFQLGFIANLLSSPLLSDEIVHSSVDKDCELISELQGKLQGRKLAQADLSRILDTLLNSCELPGMMKIIVDTKLAETLLELIPRFQSIDEIMIKIVSFFIALAEHDISDNRYFRTLCEFLNECVTANRTLKPEYLFTIAALLELSCDNRRHQEQSRAYT